MLCSLQGLSPGRLVVKGVVQKTLAVPQAVARRLGSPASKGPACAESSIPDGANGEQQQKEEGQQQQEQEAAAAGEAEAPAAVDEGELQEGSDGGGSGAPPRAALVSG